MGLNRQKGYNLCTGNYVLFIDDDDYFIDNNYFQDTINIFQNDNINIICSNTYIHYEKENIYLLNKLNIPNMIDSLKYLEKFQFEYKKPTSSFPAIFRKQILDKAKFNEMKMMNDTSIYLRAMMMGEKHTLIIKL